MSLEGEQRADKEKGKVGIIKKVCGAFKLKFYIMICNITVQRFPLDMQWKGLRITRHLQYSKSFAAGFASTLKILVFTQIENRHHCFEDTMQMFQFLEGLVKSFTVSKPGWIIFTFSFGKPSEKCGPKLGFLINQGRQPPPPPLGHPKQFLKSIVCSLGYFNRDFFTSRSQIADYF